MPADADPAGVASGDAEPATARERPLPLGELQERGRGDLELPAVPSELAGVELSARGRGEVQPEAVAAVHGQATALP